MHCCRCRAAIRAGSPKVHDEQVREVEAALENPFDPSEIKWRVTNTTSDRRRAK